MSRRIVKGPNGRRIPQFEHGFSDDQLLSGAAYGRHRGVSRERIKACFQGGIINRYLNSRGRPTYHAESCDREFENEAEPSNVTVATRGQRLRGMSNEDAMEIAGDFSPNPLPDDYKAEKKNEPAAPDKEPDKITQFYGQARAKGMVHKAQLEELKVLKERRELVNRKGLLYPLMQAAQMARDRILGIPRYVSDDLYDLAHSGKGRQEAVHMIRMELLRSLKDALMSVSKLEIESLLNADD